MSDRNEDRLPGAMTITITAEQRDALYSQILDRLAGIDDLWIAASKADYETADRLAREFSDDLGLILNDLGWGEEGGKPVELTAPPEVLRRSFGRLYDLAAGHAKSVEAERLEARAMEERDSRVIEACRHVLVELGGVFPEGSATMGGE